MSALDLGGAIGNFLRLEACRNPERPPDSNTEFVKGCRGCAVALRVAITTPPPHGAFDGWYRSRDEIAAMLDKWWPL